MMEDKADVAASFQHVAIKQIEHRLKRAMKICEEENDRVYENHL